MSATERYEIKLATGRVIHQLGNEGHVYGFVEVQPDGTARAWRQVWFEEYAPTDNVFPGFVSAARAVIEGNV